MLLPVIESLEQYRTLYRDPEVWRPAMQVICQRHNLDSGLLELAPPGSHVVFTAGLDIYLKLFCPLWAADAISERLVLDKLTGRPELPVPQLLAESEIEGWPYMIMRAVPGIPLC